MLNIVHYKAPGASGTRALLVMLPGVGNDAAAFAANGMVAAVQARGLAVDMIAVQPQLDLYLEGDVAAALHEGIIEPARAQGYARIWLLGISLGGMGALHYTRAHQAGVEGVVLLAPFLGTRGTIAELARAGGLASWPPAGSAATALEQLMLAWLQKFLAQQTDSPKLYLGYGSDDRFAPGHKMLAAALPANRVVTAAGGHDWETWLQLWQLILEQAPFALKASHGT
jgi:pimeloyl-ACP methyl ester carboxylesterase